MGRARLEFRRLRCFIPSFHILDIFVNSFLEVVMHFLDYFFNVQNLFLFGGTVRLLVAKVHLMLVEVLVANSDNLLDSFAAYGTIYTLQTCS